MSLYRVVFNTSLNVAMKCLFIGWSLTRLNVRSYEMSLYRVVFLTSRSLNRNKSLIIIKWSSTQNLTVPIYKSAYGVVFNTSSTVYRFTGLLWVCRRYLTVKQVSKFTVTSEKMQALIIRKMSTQHRQPIALHSSSLI